MMHARAMMHEGLLRLQRKTWKEGNSGKKHVSALAMSAVALTQIQLTGAPCSILQSTSMGAFGTLRRMRLSWAMVR